MQPPAEQPREGGVKVVFDVPEAEVRSVAARVAAAGFAVHRYYHPDDEHRPGGSPAGWIRLGAERAMLAFTDAEQRRIVADFDQLQAAAGFRCARIGVDSWTAGDGPEGGGPPAADREPRTPLPRAGAGSGFADG